MSIKEVIKKSTPYDTYKYYNPYTFTTIHYGLFDIDDDEYITTYDGSFLNIEKIKQTILIDFFTSIIITDNKTYLHIMKNASCGDNNLIRPLPNDDYNKGLQIDNIYILNSSKKVYVVNILNNNIETFDDYILYNPNSINILLRKGKKVYKINDIDNFELICEFDKVPIISNKKYVGKIKNKPYHIDENGLCRLYTKLSDNSLNELEQNIITILNNKNGELRDMLLGMMSNISK